MTLQDLIARLSVAAGPDRELDLAIDALVTPERYSAVNLEKIAKGEPQPWLCDQHLSNYTASIDAALTLVPDGWTRDVDATAPEMGIEVRLHNPASGTLHDIGTVSGDHRSEPIATCIASLRAQDPTR